MSQAIEQLIIDYTTKISDPKAPYYAGSAFFLISYLELSRITQRNAIKHNRYRSFALDYVEKDSTIFSVTNENIDQDKLRNSIDSYIQFTIYLDGLVTNFGNCKECSIVSNEFPVLSLCSKGIKAIANSNTKTIDYDIFEAYEKEDLLDFYKVRKDLLTFTEDVYENTIKANKEICYSLLNKLIQRRLSLPNKNNLPLEETLNLIRKGLNLTKEETTSLIKNLDTLVDNTKSSVKNDYFYIARILEFYNA